MAMKHYVYDIEVFKHGWLVVFKNIETGELVDFKCADDSSETFIEQVIEGALLCGFNNKHYDDYILKAIYHGFSRVQIKELNDWIIGGNQGWEWPKWNRHKTPFESYDVRDDLPITLSLKEIEGNMGLSIVESSVPFDLDRPLTDKEWKETIRYCRFDVEATDALRIKRQAYLKSKIHVGSMAGLTAAKAMGMTNAKLTAAFLAGTAAKAKQWGDDTDYKRPRNVKVANKEVRAFFKDIDPTYERKQTVTIAGVEHTLAYGGLHGARPNIIAVSGPVGNRFKTSRKLLNIDVTSYYPSLMIQNGYVSRAVPNPEDFEKVYHERVEAKKNGDKAKNEALKLVLNTTYGAMNNQYNPLNDPLQANSVCLSGQLYLIDLIEKLEAVPGLKLIQSNTDGILIEYDEQTEPAILATVGEWEQRTGFTMEYEAVDRIFQKDVNNYVMVTQLGKIKVKGSYVSNYTGGDIKNASLVIVAKAIVEYFINGTPVEETIESAKNILDFQMIAKTGRTYDKTIWRNGDRDDIQEIQRVNRVYASKDPDHGTIYKIKESENRKDKIANLPDRCQIDNDNELTLADIDKSFYIELAKKRIADFIGDQALPTPKPKKEDHEMATSKAVTAAPETPAPTPKAASSFGEKLFNLRSELSTYVWEKDGTNVAQKYKYITEAQYKKYFEKALEAVGLDYYADIEAVDFVQNLSQSSSGNWSHLTTVKVGYFIIDPITAEARRYTSYGQGADSGDKGIYKAMTGALKYFIANNFLIAENNDPENDTEAPATTSKRPVSVTKRQEIKEELMNKEEPATEDQKNLVKRYRDQLKAAGNTEVVKRINSTMKANPTKVQAGALIMDLEELIEELDDANE